MNLQEAIAQRQQNTDNNFYTGLMMYAMQNTPQFDMSGKSPTVIEGATNRLPNKTQLWNQFVQMKKGRLTPQDLAQFETTYNQVKMAQRDKQMNQLQQLSMRGYSDNKIRNMVKDSPVLYQNLLDMITELESSGDDNARAQAGIVEQYLPTKSFGEKYETALEESPFATGAKTLGAVATAGVVARYGVPWAINNIPDYWKSFKGNTPTEALNNWFDNKIVKKDGAWVNKRTGHVYGENIQKKFTELDEMKNRRSYQWGQQLSKSKVGQVFKGLGGPAMKQFYGQLGGSGAQLASGMLGAEQETSEKIGQGTRGLISAGLGYAGLRTALHGISKVPSPYGIAQAVGYGGLGLMGAYDIYKSLGD